MKSSNQMLITDVLLHQNQKSIDHPKTLERVAKKKTDKLWRFRIYDQKIIRKESKLMQAAL